MLNQTVHTKFTANTRDLARAINGLHKGLSNLSNHFDHVGRSADASFARASRAASEYQKSTRGVSSATQGLTSSLAGLNRGLGSTSHQMGRMDAAFLRSTSAANQHRASVQNSGRAVSAAAHPLNGLISSVDGLNLRFRESSRVSSTFTKATDSVTASTNRASIGHRQYQSSTNNSSKTSRGLISNLGRLHLAFGGVRTMIAATAIIGTPAMAGLGVALVQASGAMIAFPAAAAVAGAAIATVALGITGIRAAFAGLQQSLGPLSAQVSAVFEAGLAPAVADVNRILPLMAGGFMAIAHQMTGVARAAAATLALPQNTRILNAVLFQTAGLMNGVRGATAPMVQIILDVVAVGTQGFTGFGVKITETVTKWAEFIAKARQTGELKQWIDQGVQAFLGIWRVVSDLAVVVWQVFRNISIGAGGISNALLPATAAMRAFVLSTGGQSFLRQVGSALAWIAQAVGRILGSGLSSLAPIFGALLGVLGGVARIVGIVVMQAFQALAPVFRIIGGIINATVVPALHALAGWLERNRWFVNALVIIFGIIAAKILVYKAVTMGLNAAIMIVSGATRAWTAVTRGVAAAQAALNLVMRMNPIGLVITAVSGLVAGFVILWNKSAGFRLFWIGLWNGIKSVAISVWNAVSSAIKWAWDNIILPVANAFKVAWEKVKVAFQAVSRGIKAALDFLGIVFRALFAAVMFPILLAFRLAWLALSGFLKGLWRDLQIAWRTICDGFKWVNDHILKPVWEAIKRAWRAVSDWFVGQWNTKIQPMINFFRGAWDGAKKLFEGAGKGIRKAWQAVSDWFVGQWNVKIQPIINFFKVAWDKTKRGFEIAGQAIRAAWRAVSDWFVGQWNVKIQPIINGFRTGWDKTKRFFESVGRGIRNAWGAVSSWFVRMWNDKVKPMLRVFGEGFRKARDGVDIVVGGIRSAWNKIKGIAAKPINFFVQTVYGKGIKWAWDKVADIVGFKKLPKVPKPLPEHGWGGVIGGRSTGHDKVPIMATPGEGVIVPELTNAIGARNLNRANHMARTGRLSQIGNLMGPNQKKPEQGGPSRKGQGGDSGVWKHMRKIVQNISGARVTSTYRPGDSGWHGSGNAIDIAGPMRNIAMFLKRRFPQSTQIIYGGMGGPGNPGPNTFHGKPHWYANDAADHLDHVHWAMDSVARLRGKAPTRGGEGGSTFADILGWIGGAAKNVINWISNPVKAVMDKFKHGGKILKAAGTIPLKIMGNAASWIWDKIMPESTADQVSDRLGLTGGTRRWDGHISKALKELGQYRPGMVTKVRRRLMQESGGDPFAQNNWDSNARRGTPSKGLMQVIQPTFDAYAGKYKHLGIWNPLANIYAGLNYANNRYPSLAFGMDKPGGYDSGGWLGPGQMGVNNLREPEAVLTPQESRNYKALMKKGPGGDIHKHYHLHANVSNHPIDLFQQYRRMELMEPDV